MSTITVYVPRDTAAVAMGAHEIAQQLAAQAQERGRQVQVFRLREQLGTVMGDDPKSAVTDSLSPRCALRPSKKHFVIK